MSEGQAARRQLVTTQWGERRPRVTVLESMSQSGLDVLADAVELVYEPTAWRDPAAVGAVLGRSQGLVVRNLTRVDGRLLALAPYLQVVGRLGVGLDNLDLALLRSKGVVVTAALSANANSIAEYVVAAMLHFARRLDLASLAVKGGAWDREAATGYDLAGRTLGVVGLGDIGRRVAQRAVALEMSVLVTDPVLDPEAEVLAELGARLVPLERLLRGSDVVTLHLPLRADTRHLIGAPQLALMKPGAVLVNAGRGGLVDEQALASALAGGQLGGVAMDVRDPEPPARPDRLAGFANALLSPHIAGRTRESDERTARMVAEDVIRSLRGEVPRGVVR